MGVTSSASRQAAKGLPQGEAGLARDRETYLRAATDILGRVGGAHWSPNDVQAVLGGLAELALDTTGADRISFFLLDDAGEALKLWCVRAAKNDKLWETSVALPSIRLAETPALAAVIAGSETAAIEDAPTSPVVPSMWAQLFEVGSLFAAPMRLGEETLGLLAVDYRPGRQLPRDLAPIVGTLAGLSALATSNVMLTGALARQAAQLQTLLDGTGALRSPRTVPELAGDVAELIAQVLDAPGVAIYLLEDEGESYRVLAQRGTVLASWGRVADLPEKVAATVRASRRGVGPQTVLLPELGPLLPSGARLGQALLLPLRSANDETFGFIVAESREPQAMAPVTLQVADALAAHVALAVERAQLDQRVALAAEFACALLSLDGFAADGSKGLLAALRQVVPPAIGFEVTGIRLIAADGQRKGTFDGDGVERRLWEAWRARRTRPSVLAEDAEAYAPIWVDGRLLGVLRARVGHPPLEEHERGLLEALTDAIAERLLVKELHDDADRRARQLAVIEERSRVAADLHASVDGVLRLIERSADALRDQLRPTAYSLAKEAEALSRLAAAGRTGLRETVASLDAFVYHPRGLPATLDHIIERLAGMLDVAADLDVRGPIRTLPLEVEGALVRMMHEVFARVESRGRASAVAVRLEYRPAEVSLEVRDDGVGLGNREDGAYFPNAHAGIRVIQSRLTELGGSFVIERPPPRGLLFRAVVPA